MTNEEAIKVLKYQRGYFCDFKGCPEQQAFTKAIKALEQTRWIPVSEWLPKEGGDYFTTISFDIGAKEPVREVCKNFFCVLSQKWLNRDEDVIAWMPLPQPYKAESEE